MRKSYIITAIISLGIISGCTSPELMTPSMIHNPLKPSTSQRYTTTKQTIQHMVDNSQQQTISTIEPKHIEQQNVFSGVKTQAHPTPSPEKEALFNKDMRKVALSTQNDPRYNRMALDTPQKKKWFKDLMYQLWDREISKEEFISRGVAKYPTHRYEFEFIANGFQNL